ncbi:MAG: hypothetical protein HY921_08210 [Elusimicrobia bacterium]|nr:hypothetical protein [Elusimicrobiota bacterium]
METPRPKRCAWRIAIRALLCLGLGFAVFEVLGSFLPESRNFYDLNYATQGEALIHLAHPAAVHVSYRLPLGPMLEAWGLFHAPAALQKGLPAAAVLMSAALTFALGTAAGNLGLGLLSALLWLLLFSSLPLGSGFYKQLFFTPFVLAAAGASVLNRRRPSLGSALLEACTVGASLLYRSTLAFLPPLSALEAWLSRKEDGSQYRGRRVLILLLVPYLYIAPWVALNWAAYREFVPFEHGAANMNIVTGALGTVACAHGDFRRLMDGPPADGYRSMAGWAAGYVRRHPSQYLRGVGRRLRYVWRLRPFLFFAALAALVCFRKNAELQVLGLFSIYFLGINCLMSVEDNYFEPLWPLLIAAAAGLRFSKNSLKSSPWATKALTALVLILQVLALWALGRISLYALQCQAVPPNSDEAWRNAAASSPADPWLLHHRGKRELGQGSLQAALGDLSRANALAPGVPAFELELALARSEGGKPASLLRLSPLQAPAFNDSIADQIPVYKALALLRSGKAKEAAAQAALALDAWRGRQGMLHPPADSGEAEADRNLRSVEDESFLGRLDQILDGKPRDLRLALLKLLAEARPQSPAFALEAARMEISLGRVDEALKILDAVGDCAGRAKALHESSFLYLGAGLPGRALEVLRRLTRDYPREAVFLKDRGICEYGLGLKAQGAASLEAALRMDPGMEEAALSLGAVYTAQKHYHDALRVYDRSLSLKSRKEHVRRLIIQSRAEASALLRRP